MGHGRLRGIRFWVNAWGEKGVSIWGLRGWHGDDTYVLTLLYLTYG